MAKIRNNEVWLEKMCFGCRFQQYTIEVCIRLTVVGEFKFFKGRFKRLISQIKVTAVVDPEAGLFSAACRARTLAESSGTLA